MADNPPATTPSLREGQKLFDDDDDDAAGFIPRNCRDRSRVFYAMLYLKIAPFVPMFRKMEAMRIQKYISLDDRVEIRDEEEEGFGKLSFFFFSLLFLIKNLTSKILDLKRLFD